MLSPQLILVRETDRGRGMQIPHPAHPRLYAPRPVLFSTDDLPHDHSNAAFTRESSIRHGCDRWTGSRASDKRLDTHDADASAVRITQLSKLRRLELSYGLHVRSYVLRLQHSASPHSGPTMGQDSRKDHTLSETKRSCRSQVQQYGLD